MSKYLRHPRYLGRLRLNGRVYDGDHQAIVDPDLFEQVAALLAAAGRLPGRGRGRLPAGRHLFTRGTLRCGRCGGSMVPRTIRPRSRTGKPYEVYRCSSRVADVQACEQTPVSRESIDTAVFDYFAQAGLDVEASRRRLLDAADRQLREARALREHAEAQAQAAAEAVQRVSRDYARGALSAESFEELKPWLVEEQKAAEAEAAKLCAREQKLAADLQRRNVEEDMLRELARVRAAIVGEVQGASGVAAVRAALLRLFEQLVFHEDLFATGEATEAGFVAHGDRERGVPPIQLAACSPAWRSRNDSRAPSQFSTEGPEPVVSDCATERARIGTNLLQTSSIDAAILA